MLIAQYRRQAHSSIICYNKHMKKYYSQIFSVTLLLVILLPIVASAAVVNGTDLGLLPCDGVKVPCDFVAFAGLINNIINAFLGISVSVAAITFSIAGGKMLFNPSAPAKRAEAIEMFRKTVIGMLIILGAWIVIHAVVGALINSDTNALRFLQG